MYQLALFWNLWSRSLLYHLKKRKTYKYRTLYSKAVWWVSSRKLSVILHMNGSDESYLISGSETVPSDGDHPRQAKFWHVRNRSDMITLLMRFPPASPMISLFYLLLCSTISIWQERIHIYWTWEILLTSHKTKPHLGIATSSSLLFKMLNYLTGDSCVRRIHVWT